MLAVLSPSKALDFDPLPAAIEHSQPRQLPHSQQLIHALQQLSPDQVTSLMHLSQKLGELNYQRFQDWQPPFSLDNAKQALFAFKGDVYLGLDAHALSEKQVQHSQQHLRILSGLYGLLRPLDLIQPYRLEMGTRFGVGEAANLYQFWRPTLTASLREDMQAVGAQTLLNLASNEYFKAIDTKALALPVVSPQFRDLKNGQYKMISFFAKKARGRMAAWLLRSGAQHPEQLRDFAEDGYRYDAASSSAEKPVFLRDAAP